MSVVTVLVNPRTGVAHLDPGCRRINAQWRPKLEERESAAGLHRCGYCYSRAGLRRYPLTIGERIFEPRIWLNCKTGVQHRRRDCPRLAHAVEVFGVPTYDAGPRCGTCHQEV